MNCKQWTGILLGWISTLSAYAGNDSLHIEISAPQLKGQQITLCSYFDRQVYKQDSLLLSSQGEGFFHKKEKIPEGLYMIYIDSMRRFDLLLGDDQDFRIAIDTTDLTGKNQVSGSGQTEAFFSYIRYLTNKQAERKKITDQMRLHPEGSKENQLLKTKLSDLNKEVARFQQTFISQHEQEWVGLFFRGLEPVKTGPYPAPKNEEEGLQEFYYLKDHYFDNINLKDGRFWRTNYFPAKVLSYMQYQVEQDPDSLANVASRLVSQTLKGDSICFPMMLGTLFNYAISSTVMGMENTWARLAEDYYFQERSYWDDSTFLKNLKTEYQKIKYNRIGMKAYDMNLKDSIGNPVRLYGVGNQYTLLYLYEPACGHCKTETPKLYEQIYKKYAGKGVDIACVYIMTDKKEWMDFVQANHLEGEHWHNLWDPDRKSYYWQFYDTNTTPSIYVLDKDKKIIAKKVSVESLDKLFDYLMGNI